jgi:uncharacterized protein with von Willebrand factor type A (vWA) domain
MHLQSKQREPTKLIQQKNKPSFNETSINTTHKNPKNIKLFEPHNKNIKTFFLKKLTKYQLQSLPIHPSNLIKKQDFEPQINQTSNSVSSSETLLSIFVGLEKKTQSPI